GDQSPHLSASGTGNVALAVLDRRAYVRSGGKRASFCGLMRSAVGIPHDVTTTSGAPLAADFADVVARARRINGFRVIAVETSTAQPDTAAVQALASQGADRALLIAIDEWKSDTMQRTWLIYRATAQVRDRTGHVIAQSEIVGNDDIGGEV